MENEQPSNEQIVRKNRGGAGILVLFLCLSLFAAAGKAQSAASMLIGQWSTDITQDTVSGSVVPQRDFNVSLTFRADNTYSYAVNQTDVPAWQLTVSGSYTAVVAPPNPNYNALNVTLVPSNVSFNGNGISASQEQTELNRLSYEGFPTTIQQTFGASWDAIGTLYLNQGLSSSTYKRVSGSVPPSTLSLKNITLSTVAPAASGCTAPPASTSFTIADGTVYLYFEATVTASDNLSASWLAPDGTTENTVSWKPNAGSLCFKGAQLNVAGDQGHLGAWRVSISDNNSQIASVSFTLSQGVGPMITSLSPTTVSAGSVALQLAVTGSGFASGAIVSANLTTLPTTFVSATQLTATVSANLLAVPGTVSITVLSGGQVSNAQSITVTPRASANLPRIGVLAQVAAGGGWDTQIYLTNSTSGTLSAALSFYSDSGAALTLPLTSAQQGNMQNVTSSTFSASIPANTTLAIDTVAVGGNNVQGWADVHSDGPLTGFAVFRYAPQGLNSGPGITTPWEGTVPLQTSLTASTVIVPFDNTSGFATGLALGNPSASGAEFVATFFDDKGNPLGSAQSINLNGNGHTAFVLNSMFAFTANTKGLMKVTGSGVMALGLRASPYGTLTSVPVPLQ